jgi:cytochrome c
LTLLKIVLGAAFAWAAAATVGAQDAGSAPPAAVYTEQQALRGREEYTTACAHCHSTDLLGDMRQEIPSLAEDDFFVRWNGRSAHDLYSMISTDMPMDKPGQLSTAAYLDILAYILQINRYPAGPAELRDAESLKPVILEKQQ